MEILGFVLELRRELDDVLVLRLQRELLRLEVGRLLGLDGVGRLLASQFGRLHRSGQVGRNINLLIINLLLLNLHRFGTALSRKYRPVFDHFTRHAVSVD